MPALILKDAPPENGEVRLPWQAAKMNFFANFAAFLRVLCGKLF
jgi:hypothetical protein